MDGRKYLSIVNRDLSQKITVSSILYIEQELRYLRIVTDRGVVVVRGKVGDTASVLPTSFVRAHSYCIVNMERMEKMIDEQVFFDNGETYRIGKNNFIHLRKKFNGYLRALE